MTAFTYDSPATLTTRSGLRIFAYVNAKGAIVTDSDCGGWTMKGSKGIKDSCGDIHPIENSAQVVADIISCESNEIIGTDEVQNLWAMLT
jgi:hypothetical protein